MPTQPMVRIDFNELSDEDLVTYVHHGEDQAFAALVQRHNRRLFRVARGVLRDDAEAEDAVQEAYLRAYSALAGFRGAARLSTWLTRIVLNVALARLRQRPPAQDLEALDRALQRGASCVLLFPGATPSPEAAVAQAEIRRLLERAVDDLPDRFRLAFMMRDIEEMSTDETAESLGIRPATVKTRLHRARRLLRKSLSGTLSTSLKDTFPFGGARCARITSRVLKSLEELSRPPPDAGEQPSGKSQS